MIMSDSDLANAEAREEVQFKHATDETQSSDLESKLKCDECGMSFSGVDHAQRHGARTGHSQFSEILGPKRKPMTEEEKAKQLEEVRALLAAKREEKRLNEIQEAKERERIRRKAGQELIQAQEQLKDKEMSKMLEQKKRERLEEKIAKQRILDQIEQDKKDRIARSQPPMASKSVSTPIAPQNSHKSESNSAKLQIRGIGKEIIHREFMATDTLEDVFRWLHSNFQIDLNAKLGFAYPRVLYGRDQWTKTLRELGFVPSASLMYSSQ